MEVLATLMKGEPERSPLQSRIVLLLSSGGQPPGACIGEHSFAEMAPFPRPGLPPAFSTFPSPEVRTILPPGH